MEKAVTIIQERSKQLVSTENEKTPKRVSYSRGMILTFTEFTILGRL